MLLMRSRSTLTNYLNWKMYVEHFAVIKNDTQKSSSVPLNSTKHISHTHDISNQDPLNILWEIREVFKTKQNNLTHNVKESENNSWICPLIRISTKV